MARNMRNEGVAEEVIMDIGGWKTASVFKRYSIVDSNDTAEAVMRVEAARKRDLATLAAQAQTAESESLGRGSGMVARKAGQTADSGLALPSPAPLPN